jgi:hypothetical protein
MTHVENISEMGGGRIKENDGEGEYCKNFYKCHNVPSVQ